MQLLQVLAAVVAQATTSQAVQSAPAPIIDTHFHAMGADKLGPPGSKICVLYGPWPQRDPANGIDDYVKTFTVAPDCARPLMGVTTCGGIAP